MTAELGRLRPEIESSGTQLAFVHIGSEENAKRFFGDYDLEDTPRLSDREGKFYKVFGLEEAKFKDVLNFATFWAGIKAMLKGFRQKKTQGNPRIMPGFFLIHNGLIVRSFIHNSASDHPEFLEFVRRDS